MIPPRSILAPVDFSESSRAALTYAARLAKHCHAQLHALHAEDPLLVAAARATGVDLGRETREELAGFMSTAFPAADWMPFHAVTTGPPVEVICDAADREQVDLIVMGARGLSGATYALFGSTTDGVLVRSNVSVLVVPAAWTPPRPESSDLSGTGPVIAALERATPAFAATAAACRLARLFDTSVEAIHVLPPIRVLDRWRAHAQAAMSDRADSARREFAAWLPRLQSEVPVHLHVQTGPVAEQLAAAAAAPGQHPLLVLGRHPPGARRSPPGATAGRILSLVQVPMLVYLGDE